MTSFKSLTPNVLSERYEQLLLEERHSDCSFLLGDGTTSIRCHRIILAAASPVFEAMFYGPLSRNDDNGSACDIEILDMAEDTFRHLISYIYKGCLDLRSFTLQDTIELYYGAEKYLLNDLIADCLDAVALKLRFDNILTTLELAVCLDLSSLLTICLNFFIRCCLGNEQFVEHLRHNYCHQISRQCLDAIVHHWHQYGPSQSQASSLFWFICEWNRHQSMECGETETGGGKASSDDNTSLLPQSMAQLQEGWKIASNVQTNIEMVLCNTKTIERCFYRACAPICISRHNYVWSSYVRCDSFTALHGVILYSRQSPTIWDQLLPRSDSSVRPLTQYLEENLLIEVILLQPPEAKTRPFHWSYRLNSKTAMYNCFLNIKWSDVVILSPDVQYEIRFTWPPSICPGVEYSTGLLETDVDGFHFDDCDFKTGSMLKGLHIVKLI